MVLLESLKGRMVGQNKDEVEEAISMVETLADQLSQREGELLHEKSEVKKLAILLKKLESHRTLKENKNQLYELEGLECLGSSLHIIPREDTAPDISTCSIQWYRIQPEGNKKEVIPGATKSVYAPEPFDVGRFVLAEIVMGVESITLATTGPIEPAAGLGSYVEALLRKHETEFNVVVVRMNGENHVSNSIHAFHVGRLTIKLSKGKTILAREFYSSSMKLCGARGGGNAAAQAIFWQAKQGLSFTLAFQSERERNAAMMLARRFAFDCNITLAGPDERASAGT